MKIGIFGNTNNFLYVLALGLRERGHRVSLIINRKEVLHRPESREPGFIDGYPGWIHDHSDLEFDSYIFGHPRMGEMLNRLSWECDFIILNDLGPSLFEYCGVPALALMTGADLTFYADFETVNHMHASCSQEFLASAAGRLSKKQWAEFIRRQRNGLLNSNFVSVPLQGMVPEIDYLLNEIGVMQSRRTFIYLSSTLDLEPVPQRKTDKLRLICGSRLTWKKPLPVGSISMDNKGTDILLRGFADFITQGGKGELVLFRKGLHIEETVDLIRELGIEDNIEWLEQVTLNEFYNEIRKADVVCEQLGDTFPGLVALDSMALGKPVIANFQPEIMSQYYSEPVPACHARNSEDVANQLEQLAQSITRREEIALKQRRFAERYLSPLANADRIIGLFT